MRDKIKVDRHNKVEIQIVIQVYLIYREENCLGENLYRLLTCVTVKSFGTNAPGGTCVLQQCNTQILRVIIAYPHPSQHRPTQGC